MTRARRIQPSVVGFAMAELEVAQVEEAVEYHAILDCIQVEASSRFLH